MKHGFKANHFTDSDGNPTGGTTHGTGFTIGWQNGPLGRGDNRVEPNGAFVEDVIDGARERIEFYQTACGGKFNCETNARAIFHLNAAMAALDERTSEREGREVEGLHEA